MRVTAAQTIRSILLFKLRYIGDVLLTTPAIRLLRSAYPSARMTMVVNLGTEDVLTHNPHLSEIVTIDRARIERANPAARIAYELSVLRQLRSKRADLAIDFDSGERAGFLSLLSGAALRVGFRRASGLRRWLYNRPVEQVGTHTVERNLGLVRQALDLGAGDDRLELYTGPEDEQRIETWMRRAGLVSGQWILIHPGGRFQYKRWAPEKWAALVDRLHETVRLPVVLAGGEKERPDIEIIMARVKRQPLSLVGQTTVLEFAALCRRATLLIGNDSGPAHIAAAVGTRVVALFGFSDPAVWRPWGEGHVVVSNRPAAVTNGERTPPVRDVDCVEGCWCTGLHAITVQVVYDAAIRALAGSEARVAQ
jgi:predicted lipopolysaccharide heptosyltransferase III